MIKRSINKVRFLVEGVKNFSKVGSVTPSGEAMCIRMTDFIDRENDRVIIELGAGDGVITRHILRKMHPEARLLSFEINIQLFKQLAEIKDPRFMPIPDSAEHLDKYLTQYQTGPADCIISAIPFLVIPSKVRDNILAQCYTALKDKGVFVQMHYAKTVRHIYEKIFHKVSVHFVPVNMPPGYVFECRK